MTRKEIIDTLHNMSTTITLVPAIDGDAVNNLGWFNYLLSTA